MCVCVCVIYMGSWHKHMTKRRHSTGNCISRSATIDRLEQCVISWSISWTYFDSAQLFAIKQSLARSPYRLLCVQYVRLVSKFCWWYGSFYAISIFSSQPGTSFLTFDIVPLQRMCCVSHSICSLCKNENRIANKMTDQFTGSCAVLYNITSR